MGAAAFCFIQCKDDHGICCPCSRWRWTDWAWPDQYSHRYNRSVLDRYSYTNSGSYFHANRYADEHTDEHADGGLRGYLYAHQNADQHTDIHSNSYTYTHGYFHRHAYFHCDGCAGMRQYCYQHGQ